MQALFAVEASASHCHCHSQHPPFRRARRSFCKHCWCTQWLGQLLLPLSAATRATLRLSDAQTHRAHAPSHCCTGKYRRDCFHQQSLRTDSEITSNGRLLVSSSLPGCSKLMQVQQEELCELKIVRELTQQLMHTVEKLKEHGRSLSIFGIWCINVSTEPVPELMTKA